MRQFEPAWVNPVLGRSADFLSINTGPGRDAMNPMSPGYPWFYPAAKAMWRQIIAQRFGDNPPVLVGCLVGLNGGDTWTSV